MPVARKQLLKWSLMCLALILGTAWPLAHFAKLPKPPELLTLALELEPHAFSYRSFDNVPVAASQSAYHFPEQMQAITTPIAWRGGAKISWDQFQELTHTHALLVLHKDKLVYENYRNGNTRDTSFASFSVSKSILAALLGIALEEGKIKSLDEPIGHYLPTLAPAYASIKINDLLNMRSGIDVAEGYDTAFSKIAYMYGTTDLNQFTADLQATPLKHPFRYNYRSVDYLILGQVLRAATGVSLARYLEQKLWQPMGAEYDASWSVDSAQNQVEKGFCCINARARDFLKFGSIYLHQGQLNGRPILPAHWSRPHDRGARENKDFAYSDGWWLPVVTPETSDYVAIGVYGQYVYVSPQYQTVVVKLSDHGAEQDEGLTVAAFQTIARDLAQKTQKAE
jgi:CubicO group peptidase (beta-lactamase class C family)